MLKTWNSVKTLQHTSERNQIGPDWPQQIWKLPAYTWVGVYYEFDWLTWLKLLFTNYIYKKRGIFVLDRPGFGFWDNDHQCNCEINYFYKMPFSKLKMIFFLTPDKFQLKPLSFWQKTISIWLRWFSQIHEKSDLYVAAIVIRTRHRIIIIHNIWNWQKDWILYLGYIFRCHIDATNGRWR